MPSDEALRVTLVGTLPLLHFSPSLVAVVRSRSAGSEEQGMTRRHSSSSAPAIRRARSAHAADDVQVRVTLRGSHSFRGFFSAGVTALPFWNPAGTGRF